MRPLLAALLALAWLPATAPPPLAVVFVDVAGVAAWDEPARAALVADAGAALAWLSARGVAAPSGVEVLAPKTLAASDLVSWEWLRHSPRRLTLHAVANFAAPHLGVGPHGWGGAFVAPDRLVVMAEYVVVSRQAVIAHELMHALAGLPDWPGCDEIDLMCSPGPAYAAGTLGCRTLDALGRPCQRTYLPGVYQ